MLSRRTAYRVAVSAGALGLLLQQSPVGLVTRDEILVGPTGRPMLATTTAPLRGTERGRKAAG